MKDEPQVWTAYTLAIVSVLMTVILVVIGYFALRHGLDSGSVKS